MNIREMLNKNPMIGWAVAGIFVLIAGGLYFFRGTPEEMVLTKNVTVLFTDTGKQVEMTRGKIELQLLGRPGVLSAEDGILNEETGKHSGVIINKADWEKTISSLNAMKEKARAQASSSRK